MEAATARIRNANAWDTRTLVTMGLLAAIGVALSFIEVGNFFGFMKYDASNVSAVIGGFILGPVPGACIGIVTCTVHALLAADFWGGIMNAVAVTVFVLIGSGIYSRFPTVKGMAAGLTVAAIANAPVMAVMGLIVTPVYTGWPVSQVLEMIVPIVLPFNLGKGAANALLAFFLMKPVKKMARTSAE